MEYSRLAEIYKKLETTSKRLDKNYHIAKLLRDTKEGDLEKILLLLQGKIFPPWDERKIGVASRLVLKAINVATGISTENIENEWRETGDLGRVAENLIVKKKQTTLFIKKLDVEKVYNNLRKLAGLQGAGTVNKKIQLIAELLTSSTPIEARYIIGTILEELRVGVGAGVLRDALVWSEFPTIKGIFDEKLSFKEGEILKINKVSDLETKKLEKYGFIKADGKLAREAYNWLVAQVENAYNLTNDYGIVAKKLREKGLKGLKELKLTPGRPIKVMLAQKVEDIKEAFERVSKPAAVEYKYDGFRMQVHGSEEKIIIFTRRLEDVTKQFPDVVSYIKNNIKAKSFILDGEAVGYDPKTKKYLPFQSISQRIKRKYGIRETAKQFPVELNVFDIIYLDGKDLINTDFSQRRKLLEKILPEKKGSVVLAEQLVSGNEKEVERFYNLSLKKGMEGAMFKKLKAPYKPGSRAGFMVKLKPVMESLDLVIVAAEWGEGKRANWLTSYTLACIDEGNFLEIGKVSTGVKELEGEDVTYSQMTELLKPLILAEKGKKVKIKPQIVIEVNYEEIQKSPTYSSGYALRFPRFIRLRERLPEDISTLETVRELYIKQKK